MRLESLVRSVAAAIAISGITVPVLAQPAPHERGYVMGIGGAAFTDVSSPLFAGGVGVNLGRNFQITAEFGRMGNVTPFFTNEDLKLLEQGLSFFGANMATTSSVPTTYVTGGVRWLIPTNTSVQPYVMGSGGVAHLTPEPTFVLQGTDVTGAVMQTDVFKTSFRDENRPLASVGGGLKVTVVKHLIADFGYRYSRIFINTDYLQDPASPTKHTGINVNRVFAGLGYQF